jgi:hypothetical protein
MRFESPGGGNDILQFSDPLNVVDPNSATALGINWVQALKRNGQAAVDPLGETYAQIVNTNFDGAKGLVFSTYAANPVVTWARTLCFPVKGNIFQNLSGKSQFSQVTLLQITGNYKNAVGPCVCLYPSESIGVTGYVSDFATNTDGVALAWRLRRAIADSYTASLISGADIINSNDVIRLSADYSTAGQVTLTLKRNAVVLGTYVDNSASRLTVGGPGLWAALGDTNPGKAELRTFSCGGGL